MSRLTSIDPHRTVYAYPVTSEGSQKKPKEVKNLRAAKQYCSQQGYGILKVWQPGLEHAEASYYLCYGTHRRFWLGPYTESQAMRRRP